MCVRIFCHRNAMIHCHANGSVNIVRSLVRSIEFETVANLLWGQNITANKLINIPDESVRFDSFRRLRSFPMCLRDGASASGWHLDFCACSALKSRDKRI